MNLLLEGLMVLTIIGGLIFCAFMVVGVVQTIIVGLAYENEVGAYYNLAVDSSTAELKLANILKFRDAVKEQGLDEGYSAWLFKFPDRKLDNQMDILDSIVLRLEKVSELDEGSFEYQQALYQLSRNDLCHRGSKETANCFQESNMSCRYRLNNAFLIAGLLFCI